MAFSSAIFQSLCPSARLMQILPKTKSREACVLERADNIRAGEATESVVTSPESIAEEGAPTAGQSGETSVSACKKGMLRPMIKPDMRESASFLIIDTNVWLCSLDAVLSLRNHRHITVIVPSAVVHELDGLKHAENRNVAFKARTAIKAIYRAIKAGESWIRGQRYDEHLDTVTIKNRDDEILSCALYFHLHVSPSVLITGDYSLAVKCASNEVPSTNMSDLLDSLTNQSSFSTSSTSTCESMSTHSTKRKPSYYDSDDEHDDEGIANDLPKADGIVSFKKRRKSVRIDIPGFCFTS